jgi:pimeloyl-ACP methyl ester carboxylesterase
MTYLDAGGVHTWYEEHGTGSPLILMHGGFSDASEFGANTPALAARFRVVAANTYLADAYAQVSPDGRDHFPVVAAKIEHMAATEPTLTTADLGRVRARTLVMAGDDDAIAPAHTDALYRGIPGSELAVIPGTSHALIIEKPALCNEIILDFLTGDPVPTFMPIRRAQPPEGSAGTE